MTARSPVILETGAWREGRRLPPKKLAVIGLDAQEQTRCIKQTGLTLIGQRRVIPYYTAWLQAALHKTDQNSETLNPGFKKDSRG